MMWAEELKATKDGSHIEIFLQKSQHIFVKFHKHTYFSCLSLASSSSSASMLSSPTKTTRPTPPLPPPPPQPAEHADDEVEDLYDDPFSLNEE